MKLTPRAARTSRYWLRLGLFALGLLALVILLAFTALAYAMVRPAPSAVTVSPADWGAAYESLRLEMPDGVALAGWYLPSRNGAAVLVLHGYGSSRQGVLFQVQALARHGFGVLAYDQRASGESGGRWRTWGAQDVYDLQHVLAYLQARPEVEPGRIGVFGHSMGAEIAVHAAARYPALQAVAADGPGWSAPSDYAPRTAGESGLQAARWLVWRLMAGISASPGAPALRESLPELAPRPLLLISTGTDHERYQAELYLAAANPPKTHWNIPEASHGSGPASRPDEYEHRLVEFFQRALLGE